MQEHEQPIIIGSIKGVYGVRGWVKVISYTRPKENLLTYSPCLIHWNDEWQEIIIEETQRRGDKLFVKFEGINSPEQARQYLHSDLAILRDNLPNLEKGKFYWCDLIGLKVFNQDNISLGTVKEIMETGANDVLLIKGNEKDKVLIPLLMDIYIKNIDIEAKTIQVDWQLEE